MTEYNLREILGAIDDDDMMGEDDDMLGEDLIGARRRRLRGGVAARLARATVAPGVPSIGGRMQPLAIGAANFVNAGPTTIILTAEPQRPCIIRKLVADEVRVGASATAAVLITAIAVGSNNQVVNNGSLPAALFSPSTQNNNVAFDVAQPGVQVSITIQLQGAPLAAGDSITVSLGAIVETIG